MPKTHTDCVALKHDIDYLIANGDEMLTSLADLAAVTQTSSSIEGWLMRIGLSIRTLFHLPFNRRRDGNTAIGLSLKSYVKDSIQYQLIFDNFGVNLKNW